MPAIAVMTLALGAGGTAAIFSIVRAVLLDPLPIRDEQQVGVFWNTFDWTEEEFLFLRPNFPGFSRVAAYHPQDYTLDTPGQPLRLIRGIASSAELFDVLGTSPLFGRTFQNGEDVTGGQRAAVLSHALWRDLGSDRAIVGRHAATRWDRPHRRWRHASGLLVPDPRGPGMDDEPDERAAACGDVCLDRPH